MTAKAVIHDEGPNFIRLSPWMAVRTAMTFTL